MGASPTTDAIVNKLVLFDEYNVSSLSTEEAAILYPEAVKQRLQWLDTWSEWAIDANSILWFLGFHPNRKNAAPRDKRLWIAEWWDEDLKKWVQAENTDLPRSADAINPRPPIV